MGAGCLDAAEGHAQVLGLQHHPDALGLELGLEPVGDLGGEPLQELQAAGEQLDHPGQLGQPQDPSSREVADVGDPGEGQQMVLAQRAKGMAGQHQLVVTLVVGKAGQGKGRRGEQLGVAGATRRGVAASSSEVGSWPSAASSSVPPLGPDQVDRWGAADEFQLRAAAERRGLLGHGVGGSGHVGSFQGRARRRATLAGRQRRSLCDIVRRRRCRGWAGRRWRAGPGPGRPAAARSRAGPRRSGRRAAAGW